MTDLILIGILATIIIWCAHNHKPINAARQAQTKRFIQAMAKPDSDHQYSILIRYDTQDNGFIATSPELGPGISAFGPTRQAALKEILIAINLAIATHQDDGEPLPTPNTIGTSA